MIQSVEHNSGDACDPRFGGSEREGVAFGLLKKNIELKKGVLGLCTATAVQVQPGGAYSMRWPMRVASTVGILQYNVSI